MARRSALPEAAAEIPATVGRRCGTCDPNPPRFLCPTCPRRAARQASDDEHGWDYLRRQTADMPGMFDCLRRDAALARTIAVTRDDHPAMPELLVAYADNGAKLGRLREEHRRRLAAERAQP
jgi:hypothetical protein